MISLHRLLIISLIIFFSKLTLGQEVQSIITASSSDQSEGIAIELYNGKQYFTGVYKANLNIGFNSVPHMAFDDIFIGKGSMTGNTEWLRSIRGTGIDRASDIKVFNDTILIAGTYSDSLIVGNDTLVTSYQRGAFIAYFDTMGNYIKSFVPDVYNAEIKCFDMDNQGNIVMIGDMYQHFNYGGFNMTVLSGINFFLLKYNPIADSVVWGFNVSGNSSEGTSLSLDQNDYINTVGLYNDGTVFIDTLINTNNVNHNFFAARFDPSGNKQWVRTIEGTEEVHGYGITSDDSSNIFVAGEFEGTISIQGNEHTSNGFYDIVLIKFDQNGNHVWSEGFGGTNSDEGYDLTMDENMDPILLAETGPDVNYKGTPLNISGWNEPLIMKVRNANSNLIWHTRVESTPTSGLVNSLSIGIEGDKIGVTGINRSSIIVNSNSYVANNNKDFYTVIINDSLTYHLGYEPLDSRSRTKLYPNPADQFFKIESDEEIKEIEIFDLNGQLKDKIDVYENGEGIDASQLESGLYLICVQFEASTTTLKLLKQ